MNIAICDDDEKELSRLHEMIDRWAQESGCIVKVFDFSQGEVLLNTVICGKRYDMFILDVLMPEMDGMTLGKRLRRQEQIPEDTPIIYLTSSKEYAVESYEVRAFHYLVKPVGYEKLKEVLSLAADSTKKRMEDVLFVRTQDGDYYVDRGEICYVLFESRKLSFVCAQKTLKSLSVSGSFKSVTAEFDKDARFFRCGASIIVNLSEIRSVDKNIITFAGGGELSVPRASMKELYQAWLDHYLEK